MLPWADVIMFYVVGRKRCEHVCVSSEHVPLKRKFCGCPSKSVHGCAPVYMVRVFTCVRAFRPRVEVYGRVENFWWHTQRHSRADSCAPDVLCRVMSESHLLSLWMVDIGTSPIQHCWPMDSLTPRLAYWWVKTTAARLCRQIKTQQRGGRCSEGMPGRLESCVAPAAFL